MAYLMFFNIFTYFYYHIWQEKFDKSLQASQRRFISLIQAISFNVLSFAYLYSDIYSSAFKWGEGKIVISISPLLYSIANTISVSTTIATPETAVGTMLPIIQTFTSFIFLTLILSHTNVSGETP
jgi:hypothetical protein